MSEKTKAWLFHMGSVIDLWGRGFLTPAESLTGISEIDAIQRDSDALVGDWKKVGHDLWSAIIIEANGQKQKQAS